MKALPSEEAVQGQHQAALAQKKVTSGKKPLTTNPSGGTQGHCAVVAKKKGTSEKEPTKPSKSKCKYNLSVYKPLLFLTILPILISMGPLMDSLARS